MAHPTKAVPEKRCLICTKHLRRRRYPNGDLQPYNEFMRRKFCSRSCANSRTKGGLSRKAYGAQARKLTKKFCECCGSVSRLHAHHVDEDWKNNNPGNIQTLCVFCHQFWHATHKRLGVSPHGRMPRLFD